MGSAAETAAILRAARNLKGFNSERKEQGERPVGVDQFLSREQQLLKQQLRDRWVASRRAKTPRTYWRGCQLFIDGK
ncbi:hypothetical protein WJX73_004861 [Symbiochloris irregularis]|uniref:Uncharacterized protein n=1 Tax=Symbiochloris irregularis TaxID=706552 RepID=A0AAW1NVG6_9CHLO